MKRRNMFALGIFIVFYFSFGIFLTLNQESIVYQPFSQDFHSCDNFSTAEKVTYQGTRMYVKDLMKPIVVLYHGNAGSACNRDYLAEIFSQAGYGYVIVEYAGYSNDTVRPSHDLIKLDVQNVISYLQQNNLEDVTIVGESIGTGATTHHASIAPPEKILLISPFTDLVAVAKNRFWFYPTSLLVNNAFDNVANLEKYEGSVTIIHGTQDTIIPHKLGTKLFNSLSTDKNFVSIDGAGHNDLFMYEETITAIKEFLEEKR